MSDRFAQIRAAKRFAEENPQWAFDERLNRLTLVASGNGKYPKVSLSLQTWIAYPDLLLPLRTKKGHRRRFRSPAAAVKALGFPVNLPTASVGIETPP